MRSRLGLMLYTLRAECARDLEGTLARRSRDRLRGSRAVRPARARRARGRGPCSTSSGSPCAAGTRPSRRSRATWTALAGELRTVGSDRLVLAWIEPPATAHEADAVVARIAALANRVRDAGLRARLPQPRRRAAPAGRRSHRPRPAGRARRGAALLRSRSRLGMVRRAWSRRACSSASRGVCRWCTSRISHRAPSTASFPSATGTSATGELLPALEGLGIEWLLVEQDEVEEPALDAVRRSFAAVTDMVGSPA